MKKLVFNRILLGVVVVIALALLFTIASFEFDTESSNVAEATGITQLVWKSEVHKSSSTISFIVSADMCDVPKVGCEHFIVWATDKDGKSVDLDGDDNPTDYVAHLILLENVVNASNEFHLRDEIEVPYSEEYIYGCGLYMTGNQWANYSSPDGWPDVCNNNGCDFLSPTHGNTIKDDYTISKTQYAYVPVGGILQYIDRAEFISQVSKPMKVFGYDKEKSYQTFEDAINDGNKKLSLLKDYSVTQGSPITIKDNYDYEINLNSRKLYGENFTTSYSESYALFNIDVKSIKIYDASNQRDNLIEVDGFSNAVCSSSYDLSYKNDITFENINFNTYSAAYKTGLSNNITFKKCTTGLFCNNGNITDNKTGGLVSVYGTNPDPYEDGHPNLTINGGYFVNSSSGRPISGDYKSIVIEGGAIFNYSAPYNDPVGIFRYSDTELESVSIKIKDAYFPYKTINPSSNKDISYYYDRDYYMTTTEITELTPELQHAGFGSDYYGFNNTKAYHVQKEEAQFDNRYGTIKLNNDSSFDHNPTTINSMNFEGITYSFVGWSTKIDDPSCIVSKSNGDSSKYDYLDFERGIMYYAIYKHDASNHYIFTDTVTIDSSIIVNKNDFGYSLPNNSISNVYMNNLFIDIYKTDTTSSELNALVLKGPVLIWNANAPCYIGITYNGSKSIAVNAIRYINLSSSTIPLQIGGNYTKYIKVKSNNTLANGIYIDNKAALSLGDVDIHIDALYGNGIISSNNIEFMNNPSKIYFRGSYSATYGVHANDVLIHDTQLTLDVKNPSNNKAYPGICSTNLISGFMSTGDSSEPYIENAQLANSSEGYANYKINVYSEYKQLDWCNITFRMEPELDVAGYDYICAVNSSKPVIIDYRSETQIIAVKKDNKEYRHNSIHEIFVGDYSEAKLLGDYTIEAFGKDKCIELKHDLTIDLNGYKLIISDNDANIKLGGFTLTLKNGQIITPNSKTMFVGQGNIELADFNLSPTNFKGVLASNTKINVNLLSGKYSIPYSKFGGVLNIYSGYFVQDLAAYLYPQEGFRFVKISSDSSDPCYDPLYNEYSYMAAFFPCVDYNGVGYGSLSKALEQADLDYQDGNTATKVFNLIMDTISMRNFTSKYNEIIVNLNGFNIDLDKYYFQSTKKVVFNGDSNCKIQGTKTLFNVTDGKFVFNNINIYQIESTTDYIFYSSKDTGIVKLMDSNIVNCSGKISNDKVSSIIINGGKHNFNMVDTNKKISLYNGLFTKDLTSIVNIPYGVTTTILTSSDAEYAEGYILKVTSHTVCVATIEGESEDINYVAFKTCLDDLAGKYTNKLATIEIYEDVALERNYEINSNKAITFISKNNSNFDINFGKYSISVTGTMNFYCLDIIGNYLFDVYTNTILMFYSCNIYNVVDSSTNNYTFNVVENSIDGHIDIINTLIRANNSTLINPVLANGTTSQVTTRLGNAYIESENIGGTLVVDTISIARFKYDNRNNISLDNVNRNTEYGYAYYFTSANGYLLTLESDKSVLGNKSNFDISWYNDTETTFNISSYAQLAGLAAICNGRTTIVDDFKGKTIKLANNITCDVNKLWDPILNFKGTFDGCGHTISTLNMAFVKESGKNIGFFANFVGDSIKNLTIAVSYSLDLNTLCDDETIRIGIIVGYSSGNIINCNASGSILLSISGNTTKSYFGGAVGYLDNCGIYNTSYSLSGSESSSVKTSKLIGYSSNAEIANSYSYTNYGMNELDALSLGSYRAVNSFIYIKYVKLEYSNLVLRYYNYENSETILTDYYLNPNSGIDVTINTYRNLKCNEIITMLNDVVFNKNFELRIETDLNYWCKSEIGIYPCFYYGPLFDVSFGLEDTIKPFLYDDFFNFEVTREGSTFIGWTSEYSTLSTLIPRLGPNETYVKDPSVFENGKTYYAYFKYNNEILSYNITQSWVYGDKPLAPQIVTKYGSATVSYAPRSDISIVSPYVPTQAGLYYLIVEVVESPIYTDIVHLFEIEIEKATFDTSNIYWTQSEFTYDGTEKTIELMGYFPDGLSVDYYVDNKLTDAGTIMASVVFVYDDTNYNNVPAFTHELVINKASFDISLIRFSNTKFSYQLGVVHELKITGTLPSGLTVSYLNNTREEKGEQQATAIFDANWNNYIKIENMTAMMYVNDYLTIDMSSVSYISKSYDYTPGVERVLVITGTLPSGVSVSYSNNTRINAGVNIALAHFTFGTEVLDPDTNEVMWYTVGSGDDELRYNPINDMVAKLTINKLSYNLNGLTFEDVVETYDGTIHRIELKGTEVLPEGVTFTYTNNTLIEAGSTYASVSFNGDFDNYERIATRYATLTVQKATYDMSNIKFEDATYEYDGTKKVLEISGVLPNGVTVLYSTDGTAASSSAGMTTVGGIEIIASFYGDTKNYNLIPEMRANLSITKATYDMSNVSFKNVEYEYDGFVKKLVIQGTLPEGLKVSYTANTLSKVGSITVTAKFIGDSINYKTVNQMKATLTIVKATYDMSKITFKDATYTYTGEMRTLLINGELPNGVTVKYLDNQLINADTKVATAIFTVDTRFYNEIPNMTARLTINKAIYDMSNVKFETQRFVFDGEAHEIVINGDLPKGVRIEYENNSRVLVGNNTAIANFIIENNNYEAIERMQAVIYIDKATYDMSGVIFKDTEIVYDGQEKTFIISGVLPNGVTVSYTANKITNVGSITVTAKFSGNTATHNPISNMVATLNIIKANYDMSGVIFEDVTYKYDSYEKQLVCLGTLPEGVNVSYTNNKLTKPGELYVVATFTISDYVNYNEIDSITAKLTIEKLDYDMSDIIFEGATYVYDGKERRVEIDGVLPDGVRVEYSNNKLTNCGQVIATAAFYGDQFHNEIPNMTTTLTITKASFNLSEVVFNGGSYLYDGIAHSIYISGTLPTGAYAKYVGNEQVNPGVYTVTAIIGGDEKNYYSQEFEAILTIIPTKLESEKYRDVTYVYIETEEGFTKSVNVEYTYISEEEISEDRFPKEFNKKIALYEKVGAVFNLSLYATDEEGNKVEYQPGEVTANGKIKVKFLLPKGIAFNEIIAIYNIHSNSEIEAITFTRQDLDEEGYLHIEVDKLSDFAFVISNPDYKRNLIIRVTLYCLAVIVGIYLIIALEFLIWRKTNKAFKIMIPLFRLRSRILFKSKWNNVEIRNQDFTGEKPEKEKKDKKSKDKKKK